MLASNGIKMAANKIVLDLGCGRNKHPGSIGVDNVYVDGVDVIHDLACTPYPFNNSCADEVILSHVIEHFSIEGINDILREVYRILSDDGVVTISVPHSMSIAFNSDPTHRTRFTFETFYYFSSHHSFSYYKQLCPVWSVSRLWASVNLFNNHLVPTTLRQRKIEQQASRIMSYIVRHSRSLTLPDLIVKQFPFWLVNIHCKLQKASVTSQAYR
jgi:SAM-dependent methyltransferase